MAKASKAAVAYEILETKGVTDPQRAALYFSTILAADRGVPSRIEKIGRRTFDVVADDNRAIRFVLNLAVVS